MRARVNVREGKTTKILLQCLVGDRLSVGVVHTGDAKDLARGELCLGLHGEKSLVSHAACKIFFGSFSNASVAIGNAFLVVNKGANHGRKSVFLENGKDLARFRFGKMIGKKLFLRSVLQNKGTVVDDGGEPCGKTAGDLGGGLIGARRGIGKDHAALDECVEGLNGEVRKSLVGAEERFVKIGNVECFLVWHVAPPCDAFRAARLADPWDRSRRGSRPRTRLDIPCAFCRRQRKYSRWVPRDRG